MWLADQSLPRSALSRCLSFVLPQKSGASDYFFLLACGANVQYAAQHEIESSLNWQAPGKRSRLEDMRVGGSAESLSAQNKAHAFPEFHNFSAPSHCSFVRSASCSACLCFVAHFACTFSSVLKHRCRQSYYFDTMHVIANKAGATHTKDSLRLHFDGIAVYCSVFRANSKGPQCRLHSFERTTHVHVYRNK